MRFLSLAALKLGFADLTTKRHSALLLSSAGKTYEPILLGKKALIDALPAALTGGKPLTDEQSVNPALPKDLDARVFAYFDELSEMRGAALAARSKKAAAIPPAVPPAAP